MKEKSLFSNKLIYENQNFSRIIIEKDFNTENDIIFKNCTFQNHLEFEKLRVREIFFIKCTFKKSFGINKSEMLFLTLTECKIEEKLSLYENNCRSNMGLKNLTAKEIEINGKYQYFQINNIQCDVLNIRDINNNYTLKDSEILFLKNSKIDKVFIKTNSCHSIIKFIEGKFDWIHLEGQFEKPISFEGNLDVNYLLFESTIFNNRIDFKEGTFKYLYFHRNVFSGLVNFSGYDILENQIKNLNIQQISLHSSTFEKNISIMLPNLESITVSNSNFKQIMHFDNYYNQTAKSEMIRIGIDGSTQGSIIIENVFADINLGDINFGDIFFKDLKIFFLLIDDFQNRGNVSFSNIISAEYLIIQNSITGNLNLLNENINQFKEIVIANSNLKGMAISIYPKKVYSYSTNPKFGFGIKDKKNNSINLKNVYNQFKQIAHRNSDIDAKNYFKSKEYKQLLKTKGIHYDSVLLTLNWISNENGQNWFRGVLFTLSVALLFFYIYLKVIGFHSKQFFQDYILFLTSFPKLELERFDECSELWNVKIIIWFSRIAIGYGIYQTISAFRKFGKI